MRSTIDSFRTMIKSVKPDFLTELCETFLTDHEKAMKNLLCLSKEYELSLNAIDIKEYMMIMQSNGEFDSVECFGIELGDNSLYKKFHPSSD